MNKLRFKTISYRSSKKSDVTVFFINSFKTPGRTFLPFFKALNYMGITVVVYNYRSRPLLYSTPDEWIEFSDSVVNDIKRRIAQMREDKPSARFGVVGVSVGSVIALHASKEIKEIERTMLVSIYGSSAQQTWEHPGLGYLREYFKVKNMNKDDAARSFGQLEPTYNLSSIGNRPLLIFASKTDPVIKFTNTQILINSANELGLNYKVQIIKARRHSTANMKGLMMSKTWRTFFKPMLTQEASLNKASLLNLRGENSATLSKK